MRDDYCDGLGDCLPECPTGAITFTEREAAAYDAAAVAANKRAKEQAGQEQSQGFVCPGSMARAIHHEEPETPAAPAAAASRLSNWPVQIKLAPVRSPYFDGADLLIAADCTAYAYGNFHDKFIKNRTVLIGCPKLDDVDYSEKLAAIIANNDIKSVTIVRMEVPCCGGLEYAAKQALQQSGKFIPWHVVIVSTEGEILSE